MGPAKGTPAAAAADAAPGTSPARPSGPAGWLAELIAFNEELRRLFIRRAPNATVPPGERIRAIVASHYGISVAEISGGRSARRCAWPRQVAMYICARQAALATPSIARLFGNRDPSTVVYALRAVAARAAQDPALEREIAALIAKCSRGGAA
jgi:chromosomal replication initiator protein